MPRVLGVSPAAREKIAANPANFKVAPWHFGACHRYRDDNGEWELRRMDTDKDSERKSFPFTPPNTSVAKFIEEDSMHHANRRDTLPRWVAVLSYQQQSAGAADRPGGLGPRDWEESRP